MAHVAGEYQVVDNVYDRVCDFDYLYESYLYSRRAKRYRWEILRFSDKLEQNLHKLQQDLIDGTYKIGSYKKFYVIEPKLRLIAALYFRDRIVQWSIYRILNPFFDKMFIKDSYACRKEKGSFRAINRLQYWMRLLNAKSIDYYVLKLDIRKFFYRIDHEILRQILRPRIKDERFYRLTCEMLKNSNGIKFGIPEGYRPETCPADLWLDTTGVPIGSLCSQMFANIYLNEFDQFVKHELHAHYFARYMDDSMILGTKDQLKEFLPRIEKFLRQHLNLALNPLKTTLAPINKGIEFVGYRVFPYCKKLRKSSMKRMTGYIRHLIREYNADRVDVDELNRTLAAYNSIFTNCDSYDLKEKVYDLLKNGLKDKLELVFQPKRAIKYRPIDYDNFVLN